MRKKPLVFMLLILLLCATSIYGDNTDSGWKGYGLYNLSESGITVTNESDTVKISGSNLEASYEYRVSNDSGKEIVASLGIPDDGISKFGIYDGSKYLRYWKRSDAYVKDNYDLKNLQDNKNGWYIFNMVFSPGQSRTIKVSISAEMKKAENDTYGIGIFKDRSYPQPTRESLSPKPSSMAISYFIISWVVGIFTFFLLFPAVITSLLTGTYQRNIS